MTRRSLRCAMGFVGVAGVAGVAFSNGASAASDSLADTYRLQQQRCEEARTARLRPLRAARVEQCVRSGRERAECETFFSTYGNNTNHVDGSTVRGRFYDLPACRAADKALRDMNARQNF